MIKYKAGYKYQLADDYTIRTGIFPHDVVDIDFIRMDRDGSLLLRKGYAWNGPSGPTFDTPTFMRGSLVHDALYQLMCAGLLSRANRGVADDLLRCICTEDGMTGWRAWYVHRAVSAFGGKYAVTDAPVLTAP